MAGTAEYGTKEDGRRAVAAVLNAEWWLEGRVWIAKTLRLGKWHRRGDSRGETTGVYSRGRG